MEASVLTLREGSYKHGMGENEIEPCGFKCTPVDPWSDTNTDVETEMEI